MMWALVFSLGRLSCCGLRSLVWDACHAVGSGLLFRSLVWDACHAVGSGL